MSQATRGAIPLIVTIVLLILLGVGAILGPQIVKQRTQTKSQAGETVPTIKIVPENITGVVGETVTFNIFIDTAGKAVVGVDVDLTYDPNSLMIQESGITTGTIFTNYQGGLGGGAKLDAVAGKISLSGLTDPQASPRPTFSGDAGLFATITATLNAAGVVSIDFTPGSTDDSNLTEDGTSADVLAQVKNATVGAVFSESEGLGGGMTKKVFLLTFDPLLENLGNEKLSKKYNNPDTLTTQFVSAIREASHGVVNYQIAERREVDGYPLKSDGFQYNDESYAACIASRGSNCHQPDIIDYRRLIQEYGVCEKVNRGEIDELWLWGGPWFGYYESALAGPEGFWYNSSPITGTTCQKRLPIMGFNYEREMGLMLHDVGHRLESVMKYVHGSWATDPYPAGGIRPVGSVQTAWDRFSAVDGQRSGEGGCGNAHWPVNTTQEYKYDSSETVRSACGGEARDVSCQIWGCTQEGYFRWMLGAMPYAEGEAGGVLNNWWKYIVDIDNTPLQVVGNYGGGVTTPTWTNLSATMNKPGDVVFLWTYTGPPGEFVVDVSTVADMSSDVWGGAASSVRNTATWTAPVWDKYTCDRILYWRIRNDVGQSDIASTAVVCVSEISTGGTSPSPTPSSPPLLGDYNNDRVVNSLDLSQMYSNWGRNPRPGIDLNNDNRMNSVDYGLLVQNFNR